MLSSLQSKAGNLNSYLLMLLMFVIPITVAGSNIVAGLILLLWLFEADFSRKWDELKENPLFWAFGAYFLIFPVSLLWTQNMEWGFRILEKHLLYLYFPIFLTVVQKEHMKLYIGAFVASMTFSEMISYLLWFELIQIDGVPSYDPTPFISHIFYNPLLAIAIYYLMHELIFSKTEYWQKIFYSGFVVTMTINMFITGGRAGQVAYFVVVGVLFFQFFYRRGSLKKGFLVATGFLLSVFLLAYQFSSIFQQRVDLAVKEVVEYTPDSHGSVSYRLHFNINTLGMILEKPLLGSGIGDYPTDYNLFVGDNAPVYMGVDGRSHSHPHNHYLLVTASTGLIGLFILFSIFWFQYKLARSIEDSYQDLRIAILTLFSVILLSDAYLIGFTTTLFFIAMSAILYKRGSE